MRRWVIGLSAMGLFTGVWMVAQPPPPVPFGEMQFPQFAAPPVCDAGRLSHVYYDTDDNLPYFCDGTSWVTFTFSISGTDNVMAKFTDAGTNVEDSDMINAGVPAAGTTGHIFQVSETINIMDTGDITSGITFSMTNANHTTGAQVIGMSMNLAGGQDADATEVAFVAGSGWDVAFQSTANGVKIYNPLPVAGASGDFIDIGATLANMNGGDTVNVIDFDPMVNGTHSGANNALNFINFGNIVADANATETGILFGATGLDRDIAFQQDDHAHFYWLITETNAVFDSLDNDPSYSFKASSGTVTTVNFQEGGEITHLMGTDLSLSGTTLTIDPNSNVVEVFGDGSDTVSIITAPTDSNNTERVTFICQDADVTFLDADAAGAAGTIDLAGAATNFTCSADDTLTMAYYINPVSGNARWVEVARSVN